MNQSLLCSILLLLLSIQQRLSSSCSSYSRFDTNPDRFPGLVPFILSREEQISQAQFASKVRITKVYGSTHNDDKLYAAQVICNLKEILEQFSMQINVSQGDRRCQVIHKHTKVGDEVILLMNESNRVGRIWNLNSPGMFSIQEWERDYQSHLPDNPCFNDVKEPTLRSLATTTNKANLKPNSCRPVASAQTKTHDSVNCTDIPWHAFIWDRRVCKTRCDAVAIHDSWLLTSARCVSHYTRTPRRLVISLGVSNARQMKKSSRAKSVVLHPQWQTRSDEKGVAYDMALVKMKTSRHNNGLCPTEPISLASPADTVTDLHCLGSKTDVYNGYVKKIMLNAPNPKVVDTDHTEAYWAATACRVQNGQRRLF
ncbi:uncharacterized protein LOC134198277 [Corticium candelabrum]|uniref:uncharacterized protein LOC134198277 n=1 Tax=Corticium candelabrum TaxID=121492 RepID=UPI002E2749D4|nr:uncharacterized protein LOC134198277 [Corticium candelabrum]